MGARQPLSKYALRSGSDHIRHQQIGAVPHDHGDAAYAANREVEAKERNARLAARVEELESLLAVSLGRWADAPMGRRRPEPGEADLPPELRQQPPPERGAFEAEHHGLIADLLGSLAPGAAERRAQAQARAEAAYGAALAEWQDLEQRRRAALDRLRSEAAAHDRRIEALEAALAAGEPAAVERHALRVLEASPYPKGFPKSVTTRFAPGDEGELAVTLTAPGRDEITPKVEAFRYVPQRRGVFALRRGDASRDALYERILAQMALRSLHEVYSTDPGRRIEAVRLTLFTDAIDPATGQPVRPRMLSVRVRRRAFEALELARVDPVACVRRLGDLDRPSFDA